MSGQPGKVEMVDPRWRGWRGELAHPYSPSGGGGPGHFHSGLMGRDEPFLEDKPWGTLEFLAEQEPAPLATPPNPPPRAKAEDLGELLRVSDKTRDVSVKAKLLADVVDGQGPHTHIQLPTFDLGRYGPPEDGKIVKFTKKFTWRGTITIRTHYPNAKMIELYQCYGRGTTPADVREGNVTVGFHESCHRIDYVDFLRSHSLPEPPDLVIGMTPAEYDKRTDKFKKEHEKFERDMRDFSTKRTDEVGYKKSERKSASDCYPHAAFDE